MKNLKKMQCKPCPSIFIHKHIYICIQVCIYINIYNDTYILASFLYEQMCDHECEYVFDKVPVIDHILIHR